MKCDVIWVIHNILQNQEDNRHMVYWLSNTSALLFLLQRSLKAPGASSSSPHQKPPQPTSFFGRMAQVMLFIQFCFLLNIFHMIAV